MAAGIRAVIFDLDDTLFDRNAAQIRVVDLIMQEFSQIFRGLDRERVVAAFLESDRLADVDFHAGEPSDGLREKRIVTFLRLLGTNTDCADAITQMYVRDYPKMNIPVTGAVSVVKELSGRFRLGVISNGSPDVQYRKLEAIGLGGIFGCILLSEEIGIRKPDPRIFHIAADALRVRPDECLYVGDSCRNDVIGAQTAGMKACWYNSRSLELEPTGTKADFTVTSISELTGILETTW